MTSSNGNRNDFIDHINHETSALLLTICEGKTTWAMPQIWEYCAYTPHFWHKFHSMCKVLATILDNELRVILLLPTA